MEIVSYVTQITTIEFVLEYFLLSISQPRGTKKINLMYRVFVNWVL